MVMRMMMTMMMMAKLMMLMVKKDVYDGVDDNFLTSLWTFLHTVSCCGSFTHT